MQNLNLNIKSITRLLTCVSLVAIAGCQTVDSSVKSSETLNAATSVPIKEAASSWTQSDFINAQPQQIPVADGSVADMIVRGAQASSITGPSVSVAGAEGDASMDAAQNLFDPLALPVPSVSTQPLAVGSQGSYYSSSRLIPQNARYSYPYSTVGKIFFKDQSNGSWECSGAVIGKRLVATAGHCVHSGSGGDSGYYKDIIFIPAYQGRDTDTQAPYGTWSASWFKAAPSWVNGSGVPNSADVAILVLRDQEIGGEIKSISKVVGSLGYKSNSLDTNQIKIIGYPGAFDGGQIIHQVDSGDANPAAEQTVIFGGDMRQGSSGGPWIQNFGIKAAGQPIADNDEMNSLVGITSYVFTANEPKVIASSKLGDQFINLVREACAQAEGNCN